MCVCGCVCLCVCLCVPVRACVFKRNGLASCCVVLPWGCRFCVACTPLLWSHPAHWSLLYRTEPHASFLRGRPCGCASCGNCHTRRFPSSDLPQTVSRSAAGHGLVRARVGVRSRSDWLSGGRRVRVRRRQAGPRGRHVQLPRRRQEARRRRRRQRRRPALASRRSTGPVRGLYCMCNTR